MKNYLIAPSPAGEAAVIMFMKFQRVVWKQLNVL